MHAPLTLTAVSAVAMLAGPALAGPFNPTWVSAEAQWVAHLDAEAMRASTIGEILLHHDAIEIDWSDFDEMRDHLGFDLRTDMFGLTAYGGATDEPDEGVMIAVTTRAVDEALARLETFGDGAVKTRTLEGYEVHVVQDDDERHYLHVRSAPTPGRRLVVISDDRYELISAIKVMDGHAPRMATGESAVFSTAPQAGSILFACVAEIGALDDLEPAREIIGLSDSITVDIGEHEGALFVRADVATESDEHASNIAQVLGGLVAVGRLATHHAPDMKPLRSVLNGINFTSGEHRISLRFDHDTMELMKALEQLDD